jgi:hypothetical protein
MNITRRQGCGKRELKGVHKMLALNRTAKKKREEKRKRKMKSS